MQSHRLGERPWGLAPATRQLLDTADPAEVARRDRQIDRAIASFLAQPAGSVELDDALADQLIILADHFGVEESYFTDPAAGEAVVARRRQPIESGHQPPAPAEAPRPVAAGNRDDTKAGAARHAAHRPRKQAGVVAVAAALLVGVAVGGAGGYHLGAGAGRSEALAELEPAAAQEPAVAQDFAAPEATDHHAMAADPFRQIANRVLPGVAQLKVHAGDQTTTGSGIVLSPDGLLLTTDHVVAGAAPAGQITVLFQNGMSRPAHVVGRDPASDIAVVAVDNLTGLTPIKLGNSDTVRVGQQVVAIGSPLGPGGPANGGVVRGLNHPVVVGHDSASKAPQVLHAIQVDTRIDPVSSGGPLVDTQGLVVGIETAFPGGAAAGGGPAELGIAIPVNQAERIAAHLIKASRAGGVAPTGPAATGPAPTGPAPTGPAATGPAPTGPAPTGPAPAAVAPVATPGGPVAIAAPAGKHSGGHHGHN